MELWDAYDGNFQRQEGRVLVRGEPIPQGVYHLVCDILVRHRDGSYLLTQRAEEKHFGGMWEATAGGSALQGEGPEECARRELREETGITRGTFTELGRVVHPAYRSLYVVYLCETDQEKDTVTLQAGETQAFRWVSREALASMSPRELVTERVQIFLPELRG